MMFLTFYASCIWGHFFFDSPQKSRVFLLIFRRERNYDLQFEMELRHLRYFVAVAEALSFTKGAEKLHLAQPSLTRQIKDLEDEIGVRFSIDPSSASA